MSKQPDSCKRVVVMGAAGRDFHNYNMLYRGDEKTRVIAFTAAQIPGIGGRRYPPSLAGPQYPDGIPIVDESELPAILRNKQIDEVLFAYSDLPHEEVMHKASMVLASGVDFRFAGPDSTMLNSRLPVIAVSAVRTGCGKSADGALYLTPPAPGWSSRRGSAPPHALWRSCPPDGSALRHPR